MSQNNSPSDHPECEMGGRNVPATPETHLGGVLEIPSSETGTPPPGTPERNPLYKYKGLERSGDRCQGRPERLPERFVPTVPVHSGPRMLGSYRRADGTWSPIYLKSCRHDQECWGPQ